jgi:hypothetical protein
VGPTGPTGVCSWVSNTKPFGPVSTNSVVSCPGGQVLRGGGCTHGSPLNLRSSYPSGNGWECHYTSGSADVIIAFALCCTP